MNGLDLFPTKFFEYQIDEVDALNVLNEILRKEDDIKIRSLVREPQSTDNYISDYAYGTNSTNVELESLSKIFEDINNNFTEYNAIFEVLQYWTAIYMNSGYHSLHNHQTTLLDEVNYSGILYLSDIGGTDFYSTSPTSYEKRYYHKSQFGKVVIFPSSTPHQVRPTQDKNKRVIVSLNCKISKTS